MIYKDKNIYKTTIEESICNNRYLVSVEASPNSVEGGCNEISVSFHYKDWIFGDDLEMYSWTLSNTGEVFSINSCIDLDTLSFNCPTRITFTWNDSENCCT